MGAVGRQAKQGRSGRMAPTQAALPSANGESNSSSGSSRGNSRGARTRAPRGGRLFKSQLFKTKLCRFATAGRCRYGEVCPFAHNMNELEAPPDLKKTSLCRDWMGGRCMQTSASCPFAHGEQELRTTPAFTKITLPNKQDNQAPLMTDTEENASLPPYTMTIGSQSPFLHEDAPGILQLEDNNTNVLPVCANIDNTTVEVTSPNGQNFMPLGGNGFIKVGWPSWEQQLEDMLKQAMPDHYEE
mmetsp:Transcript_30774/g.57453  ORF Transcript_30774/g.57453 Transcript_30774/m.57453 type:complete len:243 (+) Transcript_30774:14-742(+)